MKLTSIILVLKQYYLIELCLLLPILYSFKIAINDRDFAQMVVTVCLLFLAWLSSILKSAKYIAKLSTAETTVI